MTQPLTFRERQIVAHVLYGYNNQRISEELSISPETVRSHFGRICLKLGISGPFKRQQLAVMFFGNQEEKRAA